MTLEKTVKKDLKDVQYYYLRKSNIEELFRETGTTEILSLVEKYNGYIRAASARVYDIYGCLYIQNKTQEAVAIELGFSEEFVRKIHREMLEYLCECVKKEGGGKYGQD